ncbi:hypothetical protein ACJX0J_037681, partial [Zea mays]
MQVILTKDANAHTMIMGLYGIPHQIKMMDYIESLVTSTLYIYVIEINLVVYSIESWGLKCTRKFHYRLGHINEKHIEMWFSIFGYAQETTSFTLSKIWTWKHPRLFLLPRMEHLY